MSLFSPAGRPRRVSAERVQLELSQDEFVQPRLAEAMLCMTPTSGSEDEGGEPMSTAASPAPVTRTADALGSPPPGPHRMSVAPPQPLVLPVFKEVVKPAAQSMRSLLAETLQPMEVDGMRRNAFSFDLGEEGSHPSRAARSTRGRTHGATGSRRSSVTSNGEDHVQRAGAAPPVVNRGPRLLRHRRSMSVESADAMAVAAASQFAWRDAAPPRAAMDAAVAVDTTAGGRRPHRPGDESPLESQSDDGAAPSGSHAGVHRTASSGTAHGYTSDAAGSSGLESDVVDEGRIWQVTQMLAGATVGDVVRGIVRLCNMRGGAFALLSHYDPTAVLSAAAAAASGSENEAGGAHGRRGTSTLLPLAQGTASIVTGAVSGTVLVPKGVNEDSIAVDVIQAAARPPDATGLAAARATCL